MQGEGIYPSFTHQEELQYSLTCTLNNNEAQNHCLHLVLYVPTDTFPKAYTKTIGDFKLPPDLALVFENVINLYKTIKNKENIEVLYNWGIIKIKYSLLLGHEQKQKWVEIRMDRSMEGELDEIRKVLDQKMQKINDVGELDNRIEKLWKRKQENEKIFLKFREDIQFKVQEIGERINIQNTKIGILREDLNRLLVAFDKLSAIVCPIFSKIIVSSPFTHHFILQDRKIMYIGETGSWTQILFRNQLSHKRFEISFKVVNTKRSNIVAGITLVSQQNMRSSLQSNKGDRKYLGLSGLGQLHSSEFTGGEIRNEPDKQRDQKEKEEKSNYEITISSPLTSGVKGTSPWRQVSTNQSFKPMQIIKMCVELDREKITWKSGNKVILETKVGADLRNEPVAAYFEFCDTGDSIECMDL